MLTFSNNKQMLEITARFLEERHRFANADGDVIIANAWANGEINERVSLKGQADQNELREGQTYRFYGRWTEYKNKRTGQKEKQFAFDSFVPDRPADREGVIGYLSSHGEGHGLGRVRCAKLWDIFGEDAVRIARQEPTTVVETLANCGLRISTENMAKVSENLKKDELLEACMLETMRLVNGRGFPRATAKNAVKLWGNLAADMIRRNPYVMMKRLLGCGFKRCDALYLELKLPPAALKRQALCAWYEIASSTEGHTWFPQRKAMDGIKRNIGGTDLQPEKAMELARRARYTLEERTEGIQGPISARGSHGWIAEYTKAKHEKELGAAIAAAMRETVWWPSVDDLGTISDHQRAELAKALRGAVGILGGSPGTGKTFTAAVLIKYLVEEIGAANIGIGAPTGKAAVRVTENLAKYGLSLRARTWHSHLAALGDRSHFNFKVLIGDETSMNDTDLMASIFRHRAVGTHVLLVGDVNQLPPVGHGAPLRDMIAAELPYGELREIKRNSGGIVETCAAIRDGKRWEAGDNLVLEECFSDAEQKAQMLEWIEDARQVGCDPIWDCQVLTAVNAKSPLARRELNKLLQGELNAHGEQREGCPFRVGDKIVNTQNGFFPALEVKQGKNDEEPTTNERGEVYVANGELAEVIDLEEKAVIAKLTAPERTIRIPRGKAADTAEDPQAAGDGDGGDSDKTGTGCSWDLGYALSVHRAQGSEWPVVIVMLDDYPGAARICDRSWLYTAISRAKDRCVLIGKRSVADAMCKKLAIRDRKTLLKERILMEVARHELGEM